MSSNLMTITEIHEFGVQAVFEYLKKEKYEIQAVNTNISTNPQIVAKKNKQLNFIVVRTALYPDKGKIENDQVALHCIAHAEKNNALCRFASVGIANSAGTNDAEMAIPVKGAGYYVSFEGLEFLARSDRVKVFNKN